MKNSASCWIMMAVIGCVPLSYASADTIVEPFSYPIQDDLTGFPSGSHTVYRITTTGTHGGVLDLTVATFSEGLASSAGIVSDASNPVGYLGTSSTTVSPNALDEFLGIVDVPGFGDTAAGGPFGNFFSSPQDMSDVNGSLDIRLALGSNATSFRFLATDASDNAIATNAFELTGSFQTFGFSTADFVNLVEGVGFDETEVIMFSAEFFADADGAGLIDALEFRVDNLVLNTIPEPAGLLPVLVGCVIFASRFRRRRHSLRN